MNRIKSHARVRRAPSKTLRSVIKTRVFFPTPKSARFVIYVVDKGIWCQQPIMRPFGDAPLSLRPGYRVRHCKPMHFEGQCHRAMTKLAKKRVKQNKFQLCGATNWLSTAFPIPKKVRGEWRGVVDYRGVNEETLVDTYPLPNNSDIRERRGRQHLWSMIDDAFSQIPLNKDSRDFAATYTPVGALGPKCMPQGLKKSPAV